MACKTPSHSAVDALQGAVNLLRQQESPRAGLRGHGRAARHPAWPRSKTWCTPCKPTCARPSRTRSAWRNSTSAWPSGCHWRGATSARPQDLTALLASLARRAGPARCRHRSGRPAGAADQTAQAAYLREAKAVSKARAKAAPLLAKAITQAMQGLGMEGGRFEVQLQTSRPADADRAGRRQFSGRRPCRQHAAPGRQGGLGRRAVAHGAGHCRHHQPAGNGPDPDLRRGRLRRGRRRGADRGPPDAPARRATGRCWPSPTCPRSPPAPTTIWW